MACAVGMILPLPVLADSGAASDSAAEARPYTFLYEHKYKTFAETHVEKVGIARSFGSHFNVALAEEFLPATRADGSAGSALHSLGANMTQLDFNFSQKMGTQASFKLRLRNEFKKDARVLKPRVTVPIKLAGGFTLTPGYELQRTYYKADKPDKQANEFSLALEYKVSMFSLKYTRKEIRANSVIYNNTRSDYKNQYVVKYLGKRWTPYLEVRDVSRGSSVSGRQSDLRLGLVYAF